MLLKVFNLSTCVAEFDWFCFIHFIVASISIAKQATINKIVLILDFV